MSSNWIMEVMRFRIRKKHDTLTSQKQDAIFSQRVEETYTDLQVRALGKHKGNETIHLAHTPCLHKADYRGSNAGKVG